MVHNKMSYRPVTNATGHFISVTKEIMEEDPINRYNVGKLLLASLRRHPKYATSQIDAATGKQESFGSLLERCIKTAQALKKFGIGIGDPVCIIGRNHLDVILPFYAGMFIGAPVFGLDRLLKKRELLSLVSVGRPKIVFCETDNVPILSEISDELGFKIVTFSKLGDSTYQSFQEFLDEYSGGESIEDFKATKFDPEVTTCFICCTSGSTGLPKLANITHANIAPTISYLWTSEGPASNLREQVQLVTILSPVYWFTMKVAHILTCMYGVCKVQSSEVLSSKVIVDIVNKYRPQMITMTPGMAVFLLKSPDAVDWTCIHTFLMAGSACYDGLINKINTLTGRIAVVNLYGLTEASGRVFWKNENIPGSLGEIVPNLEAKVVDGNGKEVPNGEVGELWIKGPNVCKGYFNDPENTALAFTSDGFFKTGDLVYRNDSNRYFYVDRLKMMLNVVSDSLHYHISPAEIEREVQKIPGVLDAMVTGVKLDDIDLPIALVVKKNGVNLTEEHIHQYVQKNMSKSKHLTGGVMFVDALPLLSAGKGDRMKVKEIANQYYKAKHLKN